MDLERRLERLEALAGGVAETDTEREERRRLIREGAEGANSRAVRHGRIQPFEIAPNGDVVCSRDGRPVITFRQTLAEPWYWEEVEHSYGHLAHDEEAETFRTHAGDLALSRDVVDLQYLIPDRPL
jgi:hypothetical protein